ncbi:MAG TPA: alanine dehydrogenase, partial [Thermodesulfobacteriota bacterium]
MIIGVPKERKVHEYRVALTPQSVRVLVQRGNRVIVEKNAGVGSKISDEEFRRAGAEIVESEEELFKLS